jgi:hypothetical protein
MRKRQIGSLVALVALVTLTAAGARANMAAPITSPGKVSGPILGPSTPLIVEREKLSIRCGDGGDGIECAFEARYTIANPDAEARGGTAAFYGLHTTGVVVRVNGRDAAAPLSAEQVKELDAEVRAAEGGEDTFEDFKGMVETTGFSVQVPANGRVEVMATGKILPLRTIYGSYESDALPTRHLVLHAGDPASPMYSVHYLVSPIHTWAAVHQMDVEVRYPSSYEVYPSLRAGHVTQGGAWNKREERGETILSMKLDGARAGAMKVGAISLDIATPGDKIQHGGPLIGIGGVVGSGPAAGFRMRAGYEIAAPTWLVESISADFDFRNRLIVTPAVEAATPGLFFIPSLGIGAGVPVQILPTPTVGARLLGTIQFPLLGFVASFDVFPGLRPEEGRYQVALMGRVSL